MIQRTSTQPGSRGSRRRMPNKKSAGGTQLPQKRERVCANTRSTHGHTVVATSGCSGLFPNDGRTAVRYWPLLLALLRVAQRPEALQGRHATARGRWNAEKPSTATCPHAPGERTLNATGPCPTPAYPEPQPTPPAPPRASRELPPGRSASYAASPIPPSSACCPRTP